MALHKPINYLGSVTHHHFQSLRVIANWLSLNEISVLLYCQGMMSITPSFPNSLKGQTVGLTGIFDGDTSNDFTYLNGTTSISSNSTESEIFDWASTCTYENNHI